MSENTDMSDFVAQGAEPQAPKTVAQMLGEIVWLMSQSPIHKQLFIGDLEWFAMPAVLLEQFRIFYGPNAPAAVALWARVSEETEQRLEGGAHKLRPDEWKAGDRPWLIELVAPFGAQDEILADLSRTVFGGETFKYHTTTADGQRVVATYEASDPASLN